MAHQQETTSSPGNFLQLSIPTRDATYYISDGNTVLLVESTLFKVHRSRLTQDKSMFESMFSLSSEADTPATPEGDADENPIRLPDRADEIRALLWALYALPDELSAALSPHANCMQLYDLGNIAHKYQFRRLESWALGALQIYYTRPGLLDTLTTHEHDMGLSLAKLTDLAALCERTDLLETTVRRWKQQLGEGKDVALAMGIAERLNIRPLLGLAYHTMLLRGRDAWDADPHLTRAQRVRLLSGHYALTALWEALPGAPPPLAHGPRCQAQARCAKAWASLWARALEIGAQVVPLSHADVPGKLMLAQSFLRGLVTQDIPAQTLELPFCKENALAGTEARLNEVREGLADHFTDVA